MTTKSILETLQRFFFMQQRIAEADRVASATGGSGAGHARAARQLLAAAESFDNEAERQLGAIVLLRDAAVIAAQGVCQRRKLAEPDASIAATWEALGNLPALQTVLQSLSTDTRERMERVVMLGVGVDYGEWTSAELAAFKQSMLVVTRWLVIDLETEVLAPRRLRLVRLWRLIGAGVVVALLAMWGVKKVRRLIVPKPTNDGTINVALNKSVEMSSNWRTDVYPPARLTDGDTTKIGCHSSSQPNPWALIDLGNVYNIHRVVVTNRTDGQMEFAVPSIIEVSTDGSGFFEYARRDEVFTTWTAKGKRTEARYVRVGILRTSILHLNEVEVY